MTREQPCAVRHDGGASVTAPDAAVLARRIQASAGVLDAIVRDLPVSLADVEREWSARSERRRVADAGLAVVDLLRHVTGYGRSPLAVKLMLTVLDALASSIRTSTELFADARAVFAAARIDDARQFSSAARDLLDGLAERAARPSDMSPRRNVA